jgi:hypothetical protein
MALTGSRQPENIYHAVEVLAELAEGCVAHDVIAGLLDAVLLDVAPGYDCEAVFDEAADGILFI